MLLVASARCKGVALIRPSSFRLFKSPQSALNSFLCRARPSTSTAAQTPFTRAISSELQFISTSFKHFRVCSHNIVWVRGGKSESTSNHDSSQSTSEGKTEGKEDSDKPIPGKAKMFLFASLAYFGNLYLLYPIFGDTNPTDSVIPEGSIALDFKTFAETYIKTGEVEKLVFLKGENKAVATLFRGAVIDGKQISYRNIVIDYPEGPDVFNTELRKAEAELGIGFADGLKFSLVNSLTTWRAIEFTLGMIILTLLLSTYLRLYLEKLVEKKIKQGLK